MCGDNLHCHLHAMTAERAREGWMGGGKEREEGKQGVGQGVEGEKWRERAREGGRQEGKGEGGSDIHSYYAVQVNQMHT